MTSVHKPTPSAEVNAFLDSILNPPPVPSDVSGGIDFSAYDDVAEEAKKAGYKRFLTKMYEEYCYDQAEKGLLVAPKGALSDINEMMRAKKEKLDALKSTHVFITVNPKVNDLAILLKKILKFSNKKWLSGTDVMYTIEQRGEDEAHMGQGIHAHILVVRGTEPNKVRKETKSTFRDICDVDNTHCLNFKFIEEKGVENMRNYIKGIKKDKEKDKKIRIDKLFRAQNKLDDFYDLKK